MLHYSKKALFVLFLFLTPLSSKSASLTDCPPEDPYLAYAETMPSPIGGFAEIYKKIVYPDLAVKYKIEGKVFVMAFVDENGNVTDCKVLHGIGYGCDEAAANAVKSTKWTPGKNADQPVKVKASLTVIFSIKN